MSAQTLDSSFRGLRLLLVEDNFLVARDLQQMLIEMECEVVGPVPSVAEALRIAARETLDGAILDINVVGGHCGPVAELLRMRGCPFIIITGYASPTTPQVEIIDAPRLLKPVDAARLGAAIEEMLTVG